MNVLRKCWQIIPSLFMVGIIILGTPWQFLIPALIVYSGGVYLVWRRVRPPEEGHCGECGYDLTGNVSGTCPECGERIVADATPQI